MAHNPTANSGIPTLRPGRIQASPWAILLVVTLGFFMILLDTTIVNIAIPSMIDGLHASLDQILWILNSYILVYAVLLISAGRLGDMFGPKKLFITGLVIFTLASAACGVAQDPSQLILFRVVQGFGGALLTPQTLSIITSIFPPEKRGAAFGVWGAVAGLAAVMGPTLGGFLTTNFSWRAIFYVNVPIGIVAVILATLIMPELTSHRRHQLDVIGVLLATSGLFAGVFALIEGQRYDWGRISGVLSFSLGSVQASLISIPTLLVASVILLTLFVLWEARQEEPLLPLTLFRDRNFSVANAISGVVAFGMLGLFMPLTIFLQSVLGMEAVRAGFVLVPMSFTSMLVAPFAGRLADRVSAKYLLSAGLILFAAGMGMVIEVASLNSTGTSFVLPLILAGIGMGLTFAPLTTVAMRNIQPRQAGSASGFLNTIRQVGATIGSAVVGAILQNRLATGMHTWAQQYAVHLPSQERVGFLSGYLHAGKSGLAVGRGQTGGSSVVHNVPQALAHQFQMLNQLVFHHAYLDAMKPSLGVPLVIVACGAFISLLLRTSRSGETSQEPSPIRGERSGMAAAGE